MPTDSPPAAARFLERALLVTIVAHGAAMLSMALLLLPGVPGGGSVSADRMAYVAAHPWLWRLGWLPWQITALSDLLIAIALFRTTWIPRVAAAFVAAMTLAAVLIEQPHEFLWITQGITLAQTSVQTGNAIPYSQFEASVYLPIAAWAGTFYTIAACGWSWCFSRGKVWNRWLTWLSVITWGILFIVGIGPLLPDAYQPSAALVAAGNAIGFVLLFIWLCAVTELVLRRSRPGTPSGRMAEWVYPRPGIIGRLLNVIANSRLLRAYTELLPSFRLRR